MTSNTDPVNGTSPANMRYRTTPSAYTSDSGPTSSCLPRACSGDMYAGVPKTAPVAVLLPTLPMRASPKSVMSTSRVALSNSTLAGFRSR